MGELMYGDAMHIRAQATIDAGRITKASGNERRGAESDLMRFSASLGNRRAMDAAGKNITAITENIGRNLDAASAGTFQGRIAAAEELGANAALAAAAGAGGSSVDSYNQTVRLNNAMQEEQRARGINSDNINASNSRGDVLTETVAGLDNSPYFAEQDYTEFVDHHKMSDFDRIQTLGMAAAATYVTGNPQAGMAFIGLGESKQAASNGDFAGAQSSLMGAVQNGMAAFKSAHDTAAGKKVTATAYNASSSVRIK